MRMLENRIKKLAMEDQKVHKRIQEARRQQSQIAKVRELKMQDMMAKNQHREQVRREEEEARRKFMADK